MQDVDSKTNKLPTIKVSERARDVIGVMQEAARKARRPKPTQWDIVDLWLSAFEKQAGLASDSVQASTPDVAVPGRAGRPMKNMIWHQRLDAILEDPETAAFIQTNIEMLEKIRAEKPSRLTGRKASGQ